MNSLSFKNISPAAVSSLNFLLWQSAYSELYFTDVFWPDFSAEELHRAIADYQHRERRFGKTSEQVTQA